MSKILGKFSNKNFFILISANNIGFKGSSIILSNEFLVENNITLDYYIGKDALFTIKDLEPFLSTKPLLNESQYIKLKNKCPLMTK